MHVAFWWPHTPTYPSRIRMSIHSFLTYPKWSRSRSLCAAYPFSSLRFLDNFLHDLLESCFSYPTHCITNSFPSGTGQLIDSPDGVPSFRIEAARQLLKELWQHSASSILVCLIQTALQIILCELHIILGRLGQLSLLLSRKS